MTIVRALLDGSTQDTVALRADAQGRLLVLNFPENQNWTVSYAYDSAGRIVSETRASGAVTQTRAYTYDASGNLTGIGAWA